MDVAGSADGPTDAPEDTGPVEAAVTLTGITKRFGDVVAVDDVTVTIANGEFFSLLGPSGCGKTTTLRMIAGLEYPSAGSIAIFGEEVGLRPPNQRPVNTVFQSYALFPHMDVARNVAFGLEMRKVTPREIEDRVARALSLVRLDGMERRRPVQLSGGQQQRVALARALVNEPKVLLLDEPLGALDLKLRQAMQLELKALQEEVGITFVYVTHDQEEALTMSDRIGVISAGRLLQVGTPQEIYEHPSSRFVADFIGETSFLEGRVAARDEIEVGDGLRIRADTDGVAVGEAVVVALRPERLRIHGPGGATGDDVNVATGRVRRRVYAGTTTQYEVELAGEAVHVRRRNEGGDAVFGPDDEVVVSWPPDAARVLSPDGAGPAGAAGTGLPSRPEGEGSP